MKKILPPLFLFLFLVSPVGAAEKATTRDDLIRMGDRVEISAVVSGDLYAAGQTVQLSGAVAGDILAAGREVVITGKTTGNVRVAGEVVRISGEVNGSITVIARSLVLTPSTVIRGNMVFIGDRAELAGALQGTLRGYARHVTVRGNIGRSVDITAEEFIVEKDGSVGGDLIVTSTIDPVVVEGATVGGTVTRNAPLTSSFQGSVSATIFESIVTLFSLLLIALVLVHLARRPALGVVSSMMRAPLQSILWGVGLTIVPPLVGVLLFFTLIGIPLAVILLVLWGVVMYCARVFVALAIGLQIIWRLDRKQQLHSILWPVVVGMLIFVALTRLPVIGALLSLVATWWALGGIAVFIRSMRVVVKETKK